MLLCILEAEENLENLRCSQNSWLYSTKIIDTCIDLTNDDKLTKVSKLSGLSKAIVLIPLGIIYPEMGKTDEAVEVSRNIKTITENMIENEPIDLILVKGMPYQQFDRGSLRAGSTPNRLSAPDATGTGGDSRRTEAFGLERGE
jgi:hypothetical protein